MTPTDAQKSTTKSDLNPQKNSLDFYQNLTSFEHFSDFTKSEFFCAVPESWMVIITDIKGSTKSIESGRYQDVNMVGAASISVLQEILDQDFPFVFGGDGATIVIPSSLSDKVFYALCGLRTLSQNNFNMQLRVGCVPVKEIYEQGGTLELAKHELSSSKCIAIFRGGGLNIAEDLIKGNEEQYEIPFQNAPSATLRGLTCNWEPIHNKRGQMLSLLVISRTDGSNVYKDLLSHLDNLFEGDFSEANPVNTENLKMKSMSSIVKKHIASNTKYLSKTFAKEVAGSLKVILSQWFPTPNMGTHKTGRLGEYIPTMRTHADYRKFDDVLRMVLDCSEDQMNNIESYLEKQYKEGLLFYGMYTSSTALMTCYVQDIEPGQHIHFIDGGDGGYAMAAKQLKAQLKSNPIKSS